MIRAEEALSLFFTDGHLTFSPYFIYVPFLNLIFLYQFFVPGKSKYVLAINQGIILTLLVVLVGGFLSPTNLILLAILPMMLGIATIKNRPFLQIPLLYEFGGLLSAVTFGIVSGTRQAREWSQEVKEIRLKVK